MVNPPVLWPTAILGRFGVHNLSRGPCCPRRRRSLSSLTVFSHFQFGTHKRSNDDIRMNNSELLAKPSCRHLRVPPLHGGTPNKQRNGWKKLDRWGMWMAPKGGSSSSKPNRMTISGSATEIPRIQLWIFQHQIDFIVLLKYCWKTTCERYNLPIFEVLVWYLC